MENMFYMFWAGSSIVGGVLLIYFIWLQNYYKNLYRSEGKKFRDMKQSKHNQSIDHKKELIEAEEPFQTLKRELVEMFDLPEYTEIVSALSEKINKLEEDKQDMVKFTDKAMELIATHTEKKFENPLAGVKKLLVEIKQYKEALSQEIDERKNLEKKLKEKNGEQDLYYKKEIIKLFKKITKDNLQQAYSAATSFYTSKQRIKAFENFFEKMVPVFNGSTDKIDIKDFNIKNSKNDK